MALVFDRRGMEWPDEAMDRAFAAVRCGRLRLGDIVKVYDEDTGGLRKYRVDSYAGNPSLVDLGPTRANYRTKPNSPL